MNEDSTNSYRQFSPFRKPYTIFYLSIRYISRKREEIALFEQSPQEFFNTLLQENISQIQFPRAIYEEFGIDIYSIRTS